MFEDKSLLVVDDEETVCHACHRIFAPQGFGVTTSSNSREGLSLAAEKDYDAILLDIKMPVMDGIEFLEQLRKTKPGVPVIFITGYPNPPTWESAMRLGTVDYVVKPFTPNEIIESVARLLRQSKPKPGAAETEASRLAQQKYLPKSELDALVANLLGDGYQVLGPRLIEGVVSLAPIQSAADLARGVRDEQNAGRYRTAEGEPELYFQYAVGPDGPKRYLFPPVRDLLGFQMEEGKFVLGEAPSPPPKFAMLGIRPCELAAIAVHDRVFGITNSDHFRCEVDNYYKQARENSLLIAVNCTRPGGTCFCASMGTGPRATEGFDLVMTELRGGFVIQVGSARGAELLENLQVREPSQVELELAELRLEQAKSRMGRQLDTRGLIYLLNSHIESPVWDDVAKRCLGCGNCTMVCPTCFCSTVVDSTGLDGQTIHRVRYWESCFTHQFSYTGAGPVRSSIRARYRHWLRHKLATFHEQFGTSGCVGCGRCITWCPVGNDLTKEVAAIRSGQIPMETPSTLT